MNNINGFRVWDKQEKKMYKSNVNSNPFVDCCGNLFKITETIHQNFKYTIELVPGSLANERYIVMQRLNRHDRAQHNIYEGDILQYASGDQFVVAFGTHPSFCPSDKLDPTNEGFCALVYENGEVLANSFNCHPLSDIENLAFKIGNIYEDIQIKNGTLNNNQKLGLDQEELWIMEVIRHCRKKNLSISIGSNE